jgi:hypothetical protein
MSLITYENLEDGQKVTANIFNERFAQIVAQINGQLDENNLKDAGISKAKLKAEVYESLYPVGSQYVNFTDPTNPATLLGFGTWQAVAGRVVVGYDAAQTEFNAAEKTGGEKTHVLTVPEMPSHTHYSIDRMVLWDAGKVGLTGGSAGTTYLQSSGWGGNVVSNTGGGGAHNNLQPYITAYVWKRVS